MSTITRYRLRRLRRNAVRLETIGLAAGVLAVFLVQHFL